MNDPSLVCVQQPPPDQPQQDLNSELAMDAMDHVEPKEQKPLKAQELSGAVTQDAQGGAEAEPEAAESEAHNSDARAECDTENDNGDQDASAQSKGSSTPPTDPGPDSDGHAEQESANDQPNNNQAQQPNTADTDADADAEADEEKKDESHEQSNGDSQQISATSASSTPQRLLTPRHGHCSMQGVRPTMEDAVVIESAFTLDNSRCTSSSLSLFAVLDGHGGELCAKFCAANLMSLLQKYLVSEESVTRALTLCIAELDEQAIKFAKDASGSTACIILIDRSTHELWCCNVGDSRCILVDMAEKTEVVQLSVEHKPSDTRERERIEAAKGWVTFGRVCGILAVSRSLGDKDFKDEIANLIISTPDITHHTLAPTTAKRRQYIVLACDGLFDVFSNEQCMEWLLMQLIETRDVQTIAERLCRDAIQVRRSKDNVSILLVHVDADETELEAVTEGSSSNSSSNSSSASGGGD